MSDKKSTFLPKDDDDGGETTGSSFKPSKKGFDMKEHVSLRIDALEAERYQEKNAKGAYKTKKTAAKNIPANAHKIKKNINLFDEDDEDFDTYTYTFLQMPSEKKENDDNRLLLGLSEDEKKDLKQKETNDIIKSQQNAGKMEALHIASVLAQDLGLRKLDNKTVARGMQQAVFEPQRMQEKIISKQVSKELGMKGKIKSNKAVEAAKGIKKVESLGGQQALKNLGVDDAVKIAEKKLDDIKMAELILEKSGQNIAKRKDYLKKTKTKIELDHFDENAKNATKDKKDNKNDDKTDLIRKNDNFSR